MLECLGLRSDTHCARLLPARLHVSDTLDEMT